MENPVLVAVLGLYGALAILGLMMYLGFKKGTDADRALGERVTLLMTQNTTFIKEMSLTTKEIAQQNKDNAIFLRLIFERVDKG